MNPSCAKCGKTVHPTEKLTAISQPWHKGCFKCTECNLTLNLRSFESFAQKPYCKAHVPKPTATVIGTDSAELKRLQNVSKLVSNLDYRADFEKSKQEGYTNVGMDAPAMQTAYRNTQHQSGVKYNQVGQESRKDSVNQPSSTGTSTPAATDEPQESRPSDSVRRAPAGAVAIMAVPGVTKSSPQVPRHVVHAEPEHQAPPQAAFSYQAVQQAPPPQAQYSAPVQQETVPEPQPEAQVEVAAPPPGTGAEYKALYQYHPDADDELTFEVGDIISDAQLVAEGWLYGTNAKTGQSGLLPEPYVQKI